jgi:tRNA(fMet)-specific endonuclease VapC
VLQAVEHEFAQAIFPYDSAAARVLGGVMAAALERGSTSRAQVSDFQIAAIAIANRLPLYTANETCNVADFEGIDGLDLHVVTPPSST